MSNKPSMFDDETIKNLREVEDSLTDKQWEELHNLLLLAKAPMMTLLMHVFQKVLTEEQGVILARVGRRWMES